MILAACLLFFVGHMRFWHPIARMAFSFGIPVLMFVYIVLLGYVYGDAKRRGMRAGMWVLPAILIPNMIGFILYFILRDPITKPCPQCGKGVAAGFAYCPSCGATLAQICPNCHKKVEPHWSHCAHCGGQLPN